MDLAWLSGLLLGMGGLVTYLVKDARQQARETINREREICANQQQIIRMYADNDRRRSDILARNNEILGQVLAVLEQAPWANTAPRAGSGGFHSSGVNRPWQDERWQQTPQLPPSPSAR